MLGLSRRGLFTGLAASAARSGGSSRASQPAAPGAGPAGPVTNVRDFGAKGNGKADDTHAIAAAIAATPQGGTVYFPQGTYMVSRTIVLKNGSSYRGSNMEGTIIRQRPGANLAAVMADENYVTNSSKTARSIQIEDLVIDGGSDHNKKGHGLVLMTDRCLVRHVRMTNIPEAGIVLSDVNAKGDVVSSNAVENRIESCTILGPGTYGIWIMDTRSSGRQTDGYLLNNVIGNATGDFGLRIERAAGWFISNNHVYHSARSGIYMAHVAGTFCYANEVDKFGLTSAPPASYFGIQVQFAMGRFRPSMFVGNLCATPEGSFPFNTYVYYGLAGDKFGPSSIIMVGNAAHNDPIGSNPHAKAAESSTAFHYDVQSGGTLNISDVSNRSDGVRTPREIPKGAGVNLSSQTSDSNTPIAAAAGLGGGAVVAGVGIASLNRQARRQVDTRLAMGHPAPSYRDCVAFIDVAETLNRWEVDSLSSAPETGTIHLTYFVPYRPIEVNQIASATGDGAAYGARLSRVGVYEVQDSGELRLLGSAGNRADDLWTEPNTLATARVEPAHGSGALLLLAGQPYAYAEIQVGGSPASRVGKVGNATLMALEPRASAQYPGYTDLPRRLPAPSQENNSRRQLYARLSAAPSEVSRPPRPSEEPRSPEL